MIAVGLGGESAVAHATVDAQGRLRTADLALDGLNARAGGRVGEVVAVPQLATAARLARRLGVIVSRGVVVADEDGDLHLWVRAQPEGEDVRLAVSGWREAPAWQPAPDAAATLAAGGDWHWETDASLRLTFVSLEAAAQAGLDAFALLGQPLTALFALDDGDDGALPILDALARRRPFDAQAARVRASGRKVLLSAEVRHDAAGAFAGLSGGAEMVATVEPVEPEALPESFTGGLDKALRRPLARIVANADSINAQTDGPIAPGYADYAADIASAGRHLLGLVDDLADLQAVERPGFRLAPEPIDLVDVARRAAGLLSVRAAAAQVTVERPPVEAVVPALGDFRRALQIAVNLVGNAIRYSPEGGSIGLSVTGDSDWARLVVTDRGKGIAPADQARIFGKFERIDPSEVGGNGLGLYIARRLARAMSGDLTVESTPGEGARFTLTLPAGPAPRR
ncbi:HAMP domain-containing sensor histidine kinase [Sphingomonas sp.]|jgi:signal transduction histidine kinase|uniref:sensor histidine kinase n=1 Tax=Sphingomonas sp. TaxID=28214 RepID=UPI002D80E835|nr:HAMP domain-containing sensor histidine kinase [Sphingomonas sp.]HEU0044908.1 HAMP domain-containing sensor histidine kinase [Sphingomonas sp.]